MPSRLMPSQIRGARGMLDWSMLELARAAGVSVSTVKRMEVDELQLVSGGTVALVQAAFETVGVYFLDDMGEGIGMRLQRR